MKKLVILFFMVVLIFPVYVKASGGVNVSTRNIVVYKGDNGSFKVIASNAAGRVNISSNSSNIKLSTTSEWVENESRTINFRTLSIGNYKIFVDVVDMATFDSEDLSGKKFQINVSVKTRPVIKSNNNKLKNLKIENYDINKINDNLYKVNVPKDVNEINIDAEKEHGNATIVGTGVKNINQGLNKFEIVITAENGDKNVIVLEIFKEISNTLDNLDYLLKQDGNLNLSLNSNSVLTKEIMDKLKDSNKNINLEFNEKNKYEWNFNCSDIQNNEEFNPVLKIYDDVQDPFNKIIGNIKGLQFKVDSKSIPLNSQLKIYVNDIYKDDNVLKLYQYNNGKLIKIKKDIIVKNGTVVFNLSDTGDFLITDYDVLENIEMSKDNTILYKIILAVETFVLIFLLLCLIYKRFYKKTN